MDQEKSWHVFYTRSRSEKKIADLLGRRGWTYYLPIVREIRNWSDRKKEIEFPLFRSYIFIKAENWQLSELLRDIPGLVCFIRHEGKPAVIEEDEILRIQQFVSTGFQIESGAVENLKRGDRVEVVAGPLMGMQGEVISISNQDYFFIRIKAINQFLKVQIGRELLKNV